MRCDKREKRGQEKESKVMVRLTLWEDGQTAVIDCRKVSRAMQGVCESLMVF